MQTAYNRRDTRTAWLMLAPFLIFFALFVLYPLVMTVVYSFTSYNMTQPMKWVGLKNYQKLLRDAVFHKAFFNTVIYAVVSTLALGILGFLTAAALNRSKQAVRWIRTLMVFPYATSMTAVSMIWLMIYDPTTGFLNKGLRLLALPTRQWLFDTGLALGCLIFVHVWKNIGYCMVIYLAGMQSVPPELYEAATVDGASEWQKLKSVTLPSIRPIAFFVMVTAMIEAFKTFTQVHVMTGGDPLYATTTIVHQIYQRGFTEFKMGYASAMAVVLLVCVALFTAINTRLNRRGDEVRL